MDDNKLKIMLGEEYTDNSIVNYLKYFEYAISTKSKESFYSEEWRKNMRNGEKNMI